MSLWVCVPVIFIPIQTVEMIRISHLVKKLVKYLRANRVHKLEFILKNISGIKIYSGNKGHLSLYMFMLKKHLQIYFFQMKHDLKKD